VWRGIYTELWRLYSTTEEVGWSHAGAHARRGLIACGRTISRDHGDCTLICIGVGNRDFIDVVIPEKKRGDLFAYAFLEGTGTMKKPGSIEVSTIRGVSLKSLAP